MTTITPADRASIVSKFKELTALEEAGKPLRVDVQWVDVAVAKRLLDVCDERDARIAKLERTLAREMEEGEYYCAILAAFEQMYPVTYSRCESEAHSEEAIAKMAKRREEARKPRENKALEGFLENGTVASEEA